MKKRERNSTVGKALKLLNKMGHKVNWYLLPKKEKVPKLKAYSEYVAFPALQTKDYNFKMVNHFLLLYLMFY